MDAETIRNRKEAQSAFMESMKQQCPESGSVPAGDGTIVDTIISNTTGIVRQLMYYTATFTIQAIKFVTSTTWSLSKIVVLEVLLVCLALEMGNGKLLYLLHDVDVFDSSSKSMFSWLFDYRIVSKKLVKNVLYGMFMTAPVIAGILILFRQRTGKYLSIMISFSLMSWIALHSQVVGLIVPAIQLETFVLSVLIFFVSLIL